MESITNTNPADLSLAEASALIRAGALSPLELTQSCIERWRQFDPEVQAFAAVDIEPALSAATSLSDELVRGGWRGPLHGIPFGVKDVIDVRGMPTRGGSSVLSDASAANQDAAIVEVLRGAGVVVLGKTTTHEFAYGVTTPPTRNPWDTTRIPGGSSGGSAAAVAYGGVLGALGTDSGGSVRMPAALCGVSGLRPRPGIISLEGVIPMSWTHDTCGPMARTAKDLELLWSGMTGDRTTMQDDRSLRVGFLQPLEEFVEVDSEVQLAYSNAIEVMESTGLLSAMVDLPLFAEWARPRTAIVLSDFLAAHLERGWYPARADRYGSDVRAYLERAGSVRGADVILAERTLSQLAARFVAVFEDVDVLVLPTATIVAPRLKDLDTQELPEDGQPLPIVDQLIRTCAPVSWCRLAAISIPCGFSRGGLPVGLQLVARDEGTVLNVAKRYQSVTDHHNRRPPRPSKRQ